MNLPSRDLAIPIAPSDHLLGAATAPMTLVEYGDFQCPRCKQAAPVLKQLVERSRGKVQFVYRHFPLEDIHPHALWAAQASECAAGQQKFWAMHDLLFENQVHLEAKHLRSYAERLELDLARYQAEIDDRIYLQRIREHVDGGQRSRVRATPGLFLNGQVVDVSFGLQSVLYAVARELEVARRRFP